VEGGCAHGNSYDLRICLRTDPFTSAGMRIVNDDAQSL